MTFGELLLAFFVCLVAILIAAFIALTAALMVECTAELLEVRWQEVLATVFVIFAIAFFTWFVLGMPIPGYEDAPQPILERRTDD